MLIFYFLDTETHCSDTPPQTVYIAKYIASTLDFHTVFH